MTRVLHVEDQRPLRILVKVKLDREGIDVVEEGMNGIEVAQHLRDHPDTRAIPIVFLAARREFCDGAELEPLWALRRIATTPDDAAIPELVAEWRAQWFS